MTHNNQLSYRFPTFETSAAALCSTTLKFAPVLFVPIFPVSPQRYTGGTIGMMKGPDGSLRPEPGELQQRLTKIEELNQAMRARWDADAVETL